MMRRAQPCTDTRSVTVRVPDCALADALTKIVMASGDAHPRCITEFGAPAFII